MLQLGKMRRLRQSLHALLFDSVAFKKQGGYALQNLHFSQLLSARSPDFHSGQIESFAVFAQAAFHQSFHVERQHGGTL